MCYKHKGVLIPECMGVACAMGCGKPDSTLINIYCTCEYEKPNKIKELEKRIQTLETLTQTKDF